MNSSITFIIFNRPQATQKVFDIIRKVKPANLFVLADAPRPNYPEDKKKCAASRAVIEQVDWDCKVLTKFSDINLGCQKNVALGMDWVFQNVEETIVLEDDNLPDPTFFTFCNQLLEYYREDPRIMSINGQNIQFGRKRSEYSYYFSRYFLSWGWATWKRAWKYCDIDMKLWPLVRDKKSGGLRDILHSKRAINYWTRTFDAVYQKKLDSYSIPWVFACWIQNGLTVTPNVNLISNIGFGKDATHTNVESSKNIYADMPLQAISFPLQHLPVLIPNREADIFSQETHYSPGLFTKIKSKSNRMLGKKYI